MTMGHRKVGGDRVIENISMPACLNPRPSAWFARRRAGQVASACRIIGEMATVLGIPHPLTSE